MAVEPPPFTELAHADWSVAPNKRWVARAVWREGWTITAIEPVGPIPEFLTGLIEHATTTAVLAGFDFPIGVPAAYGAQTGLSGFPELLHAIGRGRWARFIEVARDPADISVERPFYPARASAGIKQSDLISAHGVLDLDGLRRACERKTDDRRAACPLFWTLGGNQVGRAALSGWSEVLRPALGAGAKLWPFDGTMAGLGSVPGLVLAETYPAEAYGHVGVSFSPRQSKTSQSDRQSKSDALFAWANARGVKLAPEVADLIYDGFGSDKAGEDRFDALLGLTGMIEVASGWRAEGANSRLSAWEGWILGQSDEPASTFPPATPTSPISPFAPDRSAHDLHRARAIWEGEPDPETDTFVTDLLAVWNSVHQGMPIVGPWMEARLIHMIRNWVGPKWRVSGPCQVCFPDDPDLRSRSWDIVIHEPVGPEFPPEASPGSGPSLLPVSAVRVVIDTKTNFSTPATYAAQPCFDRMNRATTSQLDALGPEISKLVLAVTSSRSADSLLKEGSEHGVQTFVLARYRASPVADGADRAITWEMAQLRDCSFPLQAFKRAVLTALA
jgi:hypothetical protein